MEMGLQGPLALVRPLSRPRPGACLARTDIKVVVPRCLPVEAQLAVGSLRRGGSLCGAAGWAGGAPSEAAAPIQRQRPRALSFSLLSRMGL